jgi:Predicted membrane protein
MSGILWIIIVGFIAGIIARMLSPGPNNPSGFILTTLLGIAGAFLSTFIGQKLGYYAEGPGAQGASFVAATIGALIVLFIWNRLVASRVISDPGNK